MEEPPLLTSHALQPVPQGFTRCPRGGPSAHRAQSTAGPWKTPPPSACARTAMLARPPTRPLLPAPVSPPPGCTAEGGLGGGQGGRPDPGGGEGRGSALGPTRADMGASARKAGYGKRSLGAPWGPGPLMRRTRTTARVQTEDGVRMPGGSLRRAPPAALSSPCLPSSRKGGSRPSFAPSVLGPHAPILRSSLTSSQILTNRPTTLTFQPPKGSHDPISDPSLGEGRAPAPARPGLICPRPLTD